MVAKYQPLMQSPTKNPDRIVGGGALAGTGQSFHTVPKVEMKERGLSTFPFGAYPDQSHPWPGGFTLKAVSQARVTEDVSCVRD